MQQPTPRAPSRSLGYRLGGPKEQAGLDMAARFLTGFGFGPVEIADATLNRLHGDFDVGAATVEVKRQPINPGRYRRNFVEVAELSHLDRHAGGFASLCRTLALEPSAVEAWQVNDHRPGGGQRQFGRPDRLSVSLVSITGSTFTMYVNPDAGHLYLYRSALLIDRVAVFASRDGLVRAMGRSNEDTFAVLVPIARHRWIEQPDGAWCYTGGGTEREAVGLLATAASAV